VTIWLLGYVLLGCGAGFVAGLFGVGGGLLIVPLLLMLFIAQQFPPDHLMHLALGTAMASIAFTSLSSLRAHHGHGAVRWEVVRWMAPGLVLGTFGGSQLAGLAPTRPLAMVFTAIAYLAALQILFAIQPRPSHKPPGHALLVSVGGLIGAVSSLIAAGGGFLSIPFMLWRNIPIHQAVGTSAALGFPLALAGTFGYVIAGWGEPGLPPRSFGYVYLPALIGIVAATMLTAPIGARVAHNLPVKKLKRAFGIFLALLATKMLHSLLTTG